MTNEELKRRARECWNRLPADEWHRVGSVARKKPEEIIFRFLKDALAAEEQAQHARLLGIRKLTAKEIEEIRAKLAVTGRDSTLRTHWCHQYAIDVSRLLADHDLLSHLLTTSEEGKTLQEMYEKGRLSGLAEDGTRHEGEISRLTCEISLLRQRLLDARFPSEENS